MENGSATHLMLFSISILVFALCPLEIHIQSYSIPHFASLMIIFMLSRRQCQLTAVGLLTFCAADGTTDHFLHAHVSDIKNYLKHINDKTLAETLQHEVGFYHEAQSKQDKRILEELFESGAIQVVVASRDINLNCHMVIVMGTQFFEGKEHRYADYPITDVLQMMGRACRPQHDDTGRCVLMCQAIKKDNAKLSGMEFQCNIILN